MRISKVYTKQGDDGSTRLGDGQKVPKHDLRVAAYGEIDELNSILGVIRARDPGSNLDQDLAEIQNELFNVGGELAMPGGEAQLTTETSVAGLEAKIDAFNAKLPPLKEFILPGGSSLGAGLHLARTACRRAERSLTELHATEPLRETLLRYINRLSDYLFVAARFANKQDGDSEVYWQKPE